MVVQKAARFVIAFCMLCAIQAALPAEEQPFDTRLIEREYRPPNDAEIETLRGFLRQLEKYQSTPARYACRCTGRIGAGVVFTNGLPEEFVSIQATDQDLDAFRHVVRTTSREKEPALVVDSRGYAQSSSIAFPDSHDWLRIGGQVFLTAVKAESVPRDNFQLPRRHRCFDPISLTLLPQSSLFRGEVSLMPVSSVYGIEILKPDAISILGNSFVMKYAVMTLSGPTASNVFTEFVDGLPLSYEMWQMSRSGNKLEFRTESRWRRFDQHQRPDRITALSVRGSKTAVFEADLDWRFDDEVIGCLFKVRDVKSAGALEW